MILQRLLNSKNHIHKAMDIATLQQEAMAQNIANIDTPQYRRKTVSFEGALEKAAKNLEGARTHQRHLPMNRADDQPRIIEETWTGSVRADGNGVSIESEMTKEAQNTMWYQALTQRAGFATLRKAINGK